MRRIALAAAAGVAGLLLSACASNTGKTVVDTRAGGPGPEGMTRIAGPMCPTADELGNLGNADPENVLPADFTAAELIMCTLETRQEADGTDYQVIVEKHANEGLDALLTELRKPSVPLDPAIMCTMDLRVVPWFELVAIGDQTIRPAVPTDACGKPSMDALTALNGLSFSDPVETRVG
jgi:hypothetical protein